MLKGIFKKTKLGAQDKSFRGQSWGLGVWRTYGEKGLDGGGLAGILLFSVEIFLETLTSIKFLESSIQQSDEVMTEEEYYLCCNFNEINKIQ